MSKTKFAPPESRDLRFERNSKFRQEDFAESVRIIETAVDGLVVIAFLFALLAVVGWLL